MSSHINTQSNSNIVSHELWRETNQTLNEHERRSQELTQLVDVAKSNLARMKDEITKVTTMEHEVNAKITEAEAALSAAEAEKAALITENAKATEEMAFLGSQLRLLSAALADAKHRLDQEREDFENEMEVQRGRLEHLVRQATIEA